MPKDIKLAKFAGFCYGVKRAVETAKKLKAENPDKNVFVLGELIHNTDVINELETLGIKTITEVPEQGDGICVVRSHGESPEIIDNSGLMVLRLLIAVGVFAITLGIMVCNKLRQPQNYIEAVDTDSVEMKTAEFVK